MVVFDSVVLTLLLAENARPPNDPETEKPVERCKARMELLVEQLHKAGQSIIIPTPVIGEVLTVVGKDGLDYVYILQRSSVFSIAYFDTRAAIELAEMNRVAIAAGDKKSGIDAPWQLIKIDRQIVSIAKVAGAKRIYTNDRTLRNVAETEGLEVIGVHELPLPAEDKQTNLLELLNKQEATAGATEDEPNAEDLEQDNSAEEVPEDLEEDDDEAK